MIGRVFATKDGIYNFVYSFGAAIVILGAWLKITHMSFGPITGNVALTVGLITEAIIFIIFAFFRRCILSKDVFYRSIKNCSRKSL